MALSKQNTRLMFGLIRDGFKVTSTSTNVELVKTKGKLTAKIVLITNIKSNEKRNR